MTTKTITGTYAAGYTLAPNYGSISITSSGDIGGTGLLADTPAKVDNSGAIIATNAGAAGVDLAAGGRVANDAGAAISGGAGAAGTYD